MTEGELVLLDSVLSNPESTAGSYRNIAVRLIDEVRRLNAMVESMMEELLRPIPEVEV